jgi:hypothetical protein
MGWFGRASDGRVGLAVVVLAHLGVSIAHGQAHTGGNVPLSPAMAAFVYVVILAGPLVGLAMSFWRPRAGAWMVAGSFAGALVFGLVNHFIIPGADRVDHVTAEWRTLFTTTALLLFATEAAGVAIGIRVARGLLRRAS